MNRKNLFTWMLVLTLALVLVVPASAEPGVQPDLAQVRSVTAAYHDIPTAQAAGYQLLPFYNQCIKDASLGAMGFHYINYALVIDNIVDPMRPEAMVYTPDEFGILQLTSVEYMVPIALWNAAHPGEWPTIFGQTFNLNAGAGMYALHAWIWRPNPSGMFSSFNPKLSCD